MTTKYEDNKGTWKQNTKKTKAHDKKDKDNKGM